LARGVLECILVHFEVTHMPSGWHFGSNMILLCHLTWDWTPLIIIIKLGLPRAALLTILTFPYFHAFQNGGPSMIYANSFKMEEPNANERKRPMGFCTSTTTMQGISKCVHKQILRQVMDLTYLTWIFSLCWVKQVRFA
jgi:hypothetical protein